MLKVRNAPKGKKHTEETKVSSILLHDSDKMALIQQEAIKLIVCVNICIALRNAEARMTCAILSEMLWQHSDYHMLFINVMK